jgi:UDP-N-acetylmuramoylalanine--D-glutamate ligase
VDLKGKSVAILGMARSGLAAAKLVKRMGGIPFVSDKAASESLKAATNDLESLGIEYETGAHSVDKLLRNDLIVLSPGIAINDPLVKALLDSGREVISELELSARLLPCPMIAVTGTNGKTTTVTLIAHILSQSGVPNALAGNIGHPLSAAIEHLDSNSWAVVEVSSFQLEAAPNFHPKVAAILNVTPDHLDRHRTLENYLELKRRIYHNQNQDDILIYNTGDPVVADAIADARSRKLGFALDSDDAFATIKDRTLVLKDSGNWISVLDVEDIPLPGSHNVENVLAAVVCCYVIGIKLSAVRNAVRSFKGVEHRLESVGTFRGVHWINDSKATNVQAGIIALQAMTSPVILLAGGRAKTEDYSRVIPYFKNKVRLAIVFGEAGPMLEKTWHSAVEIHRAGELQEAVALAAGLAQYGDTVLLSPMGSSFDQFRDYEERGRKFKQWTKHLTNN